MIRLVSVEPAWTTAVDTLLQLRFLPFPESTRTRVQHYYEADCGILATLLGRSIEDVEREVRQRADRQGTPEWAMTYRNEEAP